MHDAVGGEDVLDEEVVLPGVAEVVGVAQPGAGAGGQVLQPGRAFVGGLVPELEVGPGVAAAAGLEGVQVGVLPAERHLDDLVQLRQGGCGGQAQPPPDRRLGSVQGDLDLIHRAPDRCDGGLGAPPGRRWSERVERLPVGREVDGLSVGERAVQVGCDDAAELVEDVVAVHPGIAEPLGGAPRLRRVVVPQLVGDDLVDGDVQPGVDAVELAVEGRIGKRAWYWGCSPSMSSRRSSGSPGSRRG